MLIVLVVIAVAMLLVGGGAWYLMQPGRSNFLSRGMRKMFAPAKVQKAMLFGEDGVLHCGDYKIKHAGFIEDRDNKGAWHQIPSLMLKCQGLRRHVLLLTERNTLPYNPFVSIQPSKLEKLKNIDEIADEGATRAIDEAIKNSRNNMIASALVICACAVVLVFIIFIGFSWWQGGGKLPFVG
jgi:hypothetical protein